jgi:hypothetical protein
VELNRHRWTNYVERNIPPFGLPVQRATAKQWQIYTHAAVDGSHLLIYSDFHARRELFSGIVNGTGITTSELVCLTTDWNPGKPPENSNYEKAPT